MNNLRILVGTVILSAFLFSGCIPLFVGAGVAGGIVVSQDKVRLQYDTDFDRAWEVTHDTLDRMGFINAKEKSSGSIEVVPGGLYSISSKILERGS